MTLTRTAEPQPKPGRTRTALRTWLVALGWALSAAYFLLALVIVGLRYWVLPDIDRYSAAIEQAVSQVLGERVSIGGIRARWVGLHPEIELTNVRIHDREGRVALSLPAVDAVVGWRSLPLMSLRLQSLSIDQPQLDVRRDRSGRLFVAGIEIRSDHRGAGPWLLSQSEIVVRNARVSWDDESRAAPRLDLHGVTVVLRNSGSLHRFGLKAQAAPQLASALDIRGELRGASLENLSDWTGLAYAEIDYVDLAAWKQWIDFPIEIESGKGAVRLWLAFDRERITEATADVALAEVRARLAHDLPMLDLEYLQGRLGGADIGGIIDAQGRRIALKATGGAALPPADFTLHWERGAGERPAKGELRAASLRIEPLVQLAEYLPFPAPLRQRLAQYEPHGAVQDLRVSWTGEPDRPQRYNVRGRFSGIGIKAHRSLGGFAGLTGNVEATEAGGSLRIDAEKVQIHWPGVLAHERTELDKLVAQVSWKGSPGQWQLKFSNVALANAELAGSVQAAYSTRSRHADSPGSIDLTATVERLEARAVYRYVPFLPEAVQNYLRGSILAGQVSDGRVRLKGDLRDFPFPDGKAGLFRVSARLANGELAYADAWPKLSAIAAEIALDGTQLQINAARSTMMGARISNLRAHIPDLYHGNERLRLDGQADAPTSEFLRFIRSSPVEQQVGGFTRSLVAAGGGRLQLTLNIPLAEPAQTQIAGSYEFTNNQLTLAPQVPPFAQASGRLDFTESSLSGKNLSAQFLGGPATFALTTRGEGAYTVTAQGTANVAMLRKQFDLPILERASGNAGWRGTVNASQDRVDLLVESPLTGVAISLPPPFGKTAGEALALRLERTTRADAEFLKRAQVQRLPREGDAFAISLGPLASGVFVRRRSGDSYVLDRGALGLNEPPPPLRANGLAITGRFSHLDLDQWRALMAGGGDAAGDSVNNVSLRVSALDLAGKRLNDVTLRAAPAGGAWNAEVSSRELAGTLSWRPEGRGRVVARLKHLVVPEASPAPSRNTQGSELPALDVTAETFVLHDTQLGRLELVAVNDARDWRIEKLTLASADSTLSAEGTWQSWATRPSISMNVRLDVNNVAAFLTRFGYGGTVRGGTARLEGKVGWVGSPQSIDYPTLTGQVSLSATKGQFLKADPGIARLLGILSLQSWITLDFRELFGEGFAFETLAGTAQISKGVMTTEDFSMNGKSAQVSMTGTVDLASETQNLRVRVVPSLGDSVSAGLLLANPVAGLGAMVAQRILKDPLGRIFAFEYAVTGSWNDPQVERLGGESQAIETPP